MLCLEKAICLERYTNQGGVRLLMLIGNLVEVWPIMNAENKSALPFLLSFLNTTPLFQKLPVFQNQLHRILFLKARASHIYCHWSCEHVTKLITVANIFVLTVIAYLSL